LLDLCTVKIAKNFIKIVQGLQIVLTIK
jgi:hypothetical protein